MLTKLTIRNFQRHRKLSLELDRVTTIVGANDAGKSAVLRSLRWLAVNRPRGAAFIRKGAKRTRVSLVVDDRTIRRVQDKSGLYVLDGKQFKAFGTAVPDPIAELLNLSADNLQEQHEPVYWFSLPPSEVAKRLNRIVNLEVIDAALAESNSRVRRARIAAEIAQNRLRDAVAARDETKHVPAMARALRRIERAQRRLDTLTSDAAELADLVQRAEHARKLAKSGKRLAKDCKRLRQRIDKLEALEAEAKELAAYCEAVRRCEARQVQIADDTTRLTKRLSKLKEPKICPTCKQPIRR